MISIVNPLEEIFSGVFGLRVLSDLIPHVVVECLDWSFEGVCSLNQFLLNFLDNGDCLFLVLVYTVEKFSRVVKTWHVDYSIFDVIDEGFYRLVSVVLVLLSDTHLTSKQVLFELGLQNN